MFACDCGLPSLVGKIGSLRCINLGATDRRRQFRTPATGRQASPVLANVKEAPRRSYPSVGHRIELTVDSDGRARRTRVRRREGAPSAAFFRASTLETWT